VVTREHSSESRTSCRLFRADEGAAGKIGFKGKGAWGASCNMIWGPEVTGGIVDTELEGWVGLSSTRTLELVASRDDEDLSRSIYSTLTAKEE